MKKLLFLVLMVFITFTGYSQMKLWPFVHFECIPDQDPGNMSDWLRLDEIWEVFILDQLGCDRCGGDYQIYVDEKYSKIRFMSIDRRGELHDILIPTIGVICNLWQNGELQYVLGPIVPNKKVTIEIKYTNDVRYKYPLKLFIQNNNIGIVLSVFGKVVVIPCSDAFQVKEPGNIRFRNIYSLVGWPKGTIPKAKNYIPETGNWIEW